MKKATILFLLITSFLTPSVKVFAGLEIDLYLESPYLVNPLGEGQNSPYAPQPLFRTDGFDCTTYVETILVAHTSKQNNTDFFENLLKIRYIDGKVDFFTRAHFMEYHWIPNALKNKFIVSYQIKNAKKTNLHINLQNWFLENKAVQNKDKLYIQASQRQPTEINASIPYLETKNITKDFMQTLPDFMVVFFIREIKAKTWAGQEQSQTLVTHMGILKNNYLYHASTRSKKVSKIDLIEYLKQNPKVLGVSFYQVTT